MRLSRRLAIVALISVMPLVGACDKGPIGNTDNHITNGPPLPEVHPTPVSSGSASTPAS